jgi:hypothetical protein
MGTFRRELIAAINKHCKENGSDTPDFILAEYLLECLHAFDNAVNRRADWYGENPTKGDKILLNEVTKKPHVLTLEEAEKMASDFNYNNLCARATLFPGKSIDEIPKITAEELMAQLNPKPTKVCPDSNDEIIL